jgi:hypothetical protein
MKTRWQCDFYVYIFFKLVHKYVWLCEPVRIDTYTKGLNMKMIQEGNHEELL